MVNNNVSNVSSNDLESALTDPKVFEFYVDFLKKNSGYNLLEDKKYLLEARLNEVLSISSFNSINEITDALKSNPYGDLANDVIEAMTVNETFFFRDTTPYTVFENEILPILAEASKGRKVNIWSAACSTGQEPYSIAMVLEQKKHLYPGFTYEITATDINSRVLAKARRGIFSNLEIYRGLTDFYRDKFFKQDGSQWKIDDALKRNIVFSTFNLKKPLYEFGKKFDFVLLRNVLIYFDSELKKNVLDNVAHVLLPGGHLMLGAPENADGHNSFEKSPSLNCLFKRI